MSTPSVFPADFRLLLASQSPRRRELLAAAGVPFSVVAAAAEEESAGGEPGAVAERNALAKAKAAVVPAGMGSKVFVLGTDTIVVVDRAILGKPRDRGEAAAMLRALSGRAHQVISGVALLRCEGGREAAVEVGHAVTTVRFLPLETAGLEAYLASGEWQGKAGAYAIQGRAALFVEGIEGEYTNVVGLPLALLTRLFRRLGFDLLRGEWVEGGAV
ncbi:MAG: Maf family protein [Actinobacteria bacterium]|nr:Maf family protein [Actinomycetota bacterium]